MEFSLSLTYFFQIVDATFKARCDVIVVCCFLIVKIALLIVVQCDNKNKGRYSLMTLINPDKSGFKM